MRGKKGTRRRDCNEERGEVRGKKGTRRRDCNEERGGERKTNNPQEGNKETNANSQC